MILHLTIGRLRIDLTTEPPAETTPYPDNMPTPMEVYVPDHWDETIGFRNPTARRKERGNRG